MLQSVVKVPGPTYPINLLLYDKQIIDVYN